MKNKPFSICLALFAAVLLYANEIQNPGFEQGLAGWSALWTRAAGAGQLSLVSSPVHGGAQAVTIRHWGLQDWSFSPVNKIPVTTGGLVEYSAWLRVDSLAGSVELSCVLYNAGGTVLDWAYGPVQVTAATSGFVKITSRFIVPDSAIAIMPRFIGNDSCVVYADDFDCTITSDSVPPKVFTLKNSNVIASINVPSFSFTVQSRSTGNSVATAARYLFSVASVDSPAGGYVFHCRYINADFPVTITASLVDKGIRVAMAGDSAAPLAAAFDFPGPIPSNAGDYLIVPRASGMIWPAGQEFPFWDFSPGAWKGTMPFVGVTDMRKGYALVCDSPWDAVFNFVKPSGSAFYSPGLSHLPSKGVFGNARGFVITLADTGGYVELCAQYRALAAAKGYVRTWAQKRGANPNMDRLAGAVDFWALDGAFQTNGFLDSLIDLGIDRAILSIGGGWYDPWHKPSFVKAINQRGFLSSRYDIYTDVWPPTHPELPEYRTEGYPQDVIVDADGSLHKGWLAYLSGNTPFQGYYCCSKTHAPRAQKYLPGELDSVPYNCRFIDVELAAGLMECYSPTHPETRGQDAQERVRLLDYIKNTLGLVLGSEEAHDWAFGAVDFGEGTMTLSPVSNAGYDWSTPVDAPDTGFVKYNVNAALRVPLHGLVYHDVHVPTWYTGDGMSKVPGYWAEKELLNALYGTMPLFLPPSRQYWADNIEKFATTYHLSAGVFRQTAGSAMTGHAFLSQDRLVQKTTFANGWSVIANFSAAPYNDAGRAIPAKGLYATDGAGEISRLAPGGVVQSVALCGDRFYLCPDVSGTLASFSGVKTAGAAFLKKDSSRVYLSFIGSQPSVEIQPQGLPWPADSFTVFTKTGIQPIAVQKLSGGAVGITRQAGAWVYRLEGDFKVGVKAPAVRSVMPSVGKILYRNGGIRIQFTGHARGEITVALVSVNGRCVLKKTFVDKTGTAGTVSLPCGSLGAGMYIVEIKSMNGVWCRSVAVLR